jgi:hypothetical protein
MGKCKGHVVCEPKEVVFAVIVIVIVVVVARSKQNSPSLWRQGGGTVAAEGNRDSVDNHAHLIPSVDLWHHLQKMTILRTIGQKKRGGGGAGDCAQHIMTNSKKLPGCAIFPGHF